MIIDDVITLPSPMTTETPADVLFYALKNEYAVYIAKRDAVLAEHATVLWDKVKAEPMTSWAVLVHTSSAEKAIFTTTPPPTVTTKLEYTYDWTTEYLAVLEHCREKSRDRETFLTEVAKAFVRKLRLCVKDDRFEITFDRNFQAPPGQEVTQKREVHVTIQFTVVIAQNVSTGPAAGARK